jgi:plastocyanin
MFDSDTYRFTKSQLIISSLVVLFAIGLYATPDAFADDHFIFTDAVVENAQGSSTPGCEPNCFIPSTVTIPSGGTVTFVNNDSAAHTSTSGTPADGPNGFWDSSLVMMNSSYTTPALDAGEYPYFCMVHPWMEGLVIVGESESVQSEPESESEPEPTATTSATNTVENAEGSSTPGCEPNCFIPATITINPRETVTFVNNDTAAHTSTAGTPADGPNGFWDSSLVMMNSSYTTPALDAGEYPYFCMVHPWMEGLVIVGEGGTTTPSQAESSQAEDDAAERIAAAQAAAAAAEAEAAARIAEAEAAARIAAAQAAAAAAEAASQQAISELSVNEKIEISMDFTNDSDIQQSFALIVQIKDSNNTTISLSHVTGMLGAGQTLDQVLSYTPTEAGTYTVEKFLWNNFADPTALTDSKETFSLTVS